MWRILYHIILFYLLSTLLPRSDKVSPRPDSISARPDKCPRSDKSTPLSQTTPPLPSLVSHLSTHAVACIACGQPICPVLSSVIRANPQVNIELNDLMELNVVALSANGGEKGPFLTPVCVLASLALKLTCMQTVHYYLRPENHFFFLSSSSTHKSYSNSGEPPWLCIHQYPMCVYKIIIVTISVV